MFQMKMKNSSNFHIALKKNIKIVLIKYSLKLMNCLQIKVQNNLRLRKFKFNKTKIKNKKNIYFQLKMY